MAHPKGVLIERLQEDGKQPKFTTTSRGPDHAPDFESEVSVDGQVLGRGQGGTKRTSERKAAEEALALLDAAPKEVAKDKPAAASTRKRGKAKAGGKQGAKAKTASKPAVPSPASSSTKTSDTRAVPATATGVATESSFDGPWPVFEQVLATSLQIAHARIAPELQGDAARSAIESLALELYKNVLLDLGDVVSNED